MQITMIVKGMQESLCLALSFDHSVFYRCEINNVLFYCILLLTNLTMFTIEEVSLTDYLTIAKFAKDFK